MIGYEDMTQELEEIRSSYDDKGSSSQTDFYLWDLGVDVGDFRQVANQTAAVCLNDQLPRRLQALGYAIDQAPPEAVAVIGGALSAFFETGFVLAMRLMQKEAA